MWRVVAAGVLAPAASVFPAATALAAPMVQTRSHPTFVQLPLGFVPNRGQAAPGVKYIAHMSGVTVAFTASALVVRGPSQATDVGTHPTHGQHAGSTVRLAFVGARPHPTVRASGRLPGHESYLIGGSQSRWHTNLPLYSDIRYTALYPGIDLHAYVRSGQMEYDWAAQPGADISRIQLRVEGAQSVRAEADGSVSIVRHGWALRQLHPTLYQTIGSHRIKVAGGYQLHGSDIGLRSGRYDRRFPLVIDPALTYATYLGGGNGDEGLGVAVDKQGNAYVTGYAFSDSFPVDHPVQDALAGEEDAFVTKFDSSGKHLLYSTFIGGSQGDEALAIAVDSKEQAFLSGDSYSTDFPVVHPLQKRNRSNCRDGNVKVACPDGFVAKLNRAGTRLLFSTYLGGEGLDAANAITVDTQGNAVVAGDTDSTDFPTANALQDTKKSLACDDGTGHQSPCVAAWIAKISANGRTLLFSTYLDGSGNDAGYGVATDRAGNIFVSGPTTSRNFPLSRARQAHLSGQRDAYVAKLSPDGRTLLYSTYLGGRGDDLTINIAVDAAGSAFLTGWTRSSDFPLSSAFQTSDADSCGGNSSGSNCVHAFVTRLTPDGTGLIYSTYLGGRGDDVGHGIALDSEDRAVVVGSTTSTNFPTANASQSQNAGKNDAFVTQLSASGSPLVFSTYLGGRGEDFAHGVAVDTSGAVYVTGFTLSGNFPTSRAFQAGGRDDVFVAKIAAPPSK